MTTQTEMFPTAEADRAQAVLNFLLTRREKAEKALATAETNLDDIIVLIAKQEHIVRTLREQAVSTPTVPDPLYAMADAEPEPEDAEVLAIDGVAVAPDGSEYDTATGEVIDQEPSDEVEDSATPANLTGCTLDEPCPTIAAGHEPHCVVCLHHEPNHAEESEGSVTVKCPEDLTIRSEVGPHTRYGELIADYLAEVDATDEDHAGYVVLALRDSVYEPCDPTARIPRAEWGATFRVERKAAADEPWDYEREPAEGVA